MLLNRIIAGSVLLSVSATVLAQIIEVQPVEVLYGNRVYRGEHQMVQSSSSAHVSVIPAQVARDETMVNVVVSSDSKRRSYLEDAKVAKREQEIYDEVNRRTQEAPFTVLFTGHIPEEIQQKRLSMMPEVGIFGDQLEKLQQDQSNLHQNDNVPVDTGDFSEVVPGKRILGTPQPEPDTTSASTPAALDNSASNSDQLSDEQKLEQLIGG